MEQNIINVAASFLIKDKKVLVAQKKEDSKNPLHWEFPGGKLMTEEKFDEALIREMKEEMGLDITVVQELGSIEFESGNDVLIIMYIIVETSDYNSISLNHHKEYRYCSYSELKGLKLLTPDMMFVEQYENEIKKFID